MSYRLSLLLAAVHVPLALAAYAAWAPRIATFDGPWRYAPGGHATIEARAAAAPGAAHGAIAQCLWPRPLRSEGAGAAVGHAFCLRAPESSARHGAARPAYRT